MCDIQDVKGSVTALMLLMVVDFCKAKNISIPDDCIAYFNEDFTQLRSVHDRVPFNIWVNIINSVYHEYPISGLGFEIAKYVDTSYAGVLSYIVFSKPNLFEALVDFLRYERLVFDFNIASLTIKNGLVELGWTDYYGKSGLLIDQVIYSVFIQIIRLTVYPQKIRLKEVGFYYKEPEDKKVYEDFFGCPVYFNASKISILVSVSELKNIKTPNSDPILYQILKGKADRLLMQLPFNSDFEQRLYLCISHCVKDVSLDSVSRYMNVPVGLLKQTLLEKNINFNVIVNNIRKDLAVKYLDNNNISICEISEMLGYSEQSSFQRAFKSWMGITPLKYRNSIK